jgi:hypothetical protein
MATVNPSNAEIAALLEQIADELEVQDDNPFRVRAYREGAQSIRDAEDSVAKFIRQDKLDELKDLPNIGEGIAAVVAEYVTSGKSTLLDDLLATDSPTAIFARVPGLGKELAQRIADELHIKTLPELEEAAHDGRLEKVEGFGARRVEAVKTSLAGMLSQSARRDQHKRQTKSRQKSKLESRPSIELLLEIDSEYQKRAEAGDLRKIAPRRFNPKQEAWLPVMSANRDGWTFTALYSNTAQAHELEKTNDWVVIYYKRDGQERQNTVVTETSGALEGKRVVRGRMPETTQYYEASTARAK